MQTRGEGILARLLLIVFGVALALAVCEGAVRFHRRNNYPAARMCPEIEMSPVQRTIMDVLRPNHREVFNGVEYRFNRQGIRGPERTELPQPGVFRIVVIGDSVTMGHGVAEDDTYPSLLEARLNAGATTAKFEVINLGLSNMNLASSINRLEALGVPLHPDLIIYGFTLNDLEGPGYRRTGTGSEGFAYLANIRRFRNSPSYFLRAAWPRLVTFKAVLWPTPGSYQWELHDNYFDNDPTWRIFDEALADLAAIGQRLGVCVHVLIHTHLFYLNRLHPFTAAYDKVGAAAESHGLSVTQSFPYFDGANSDSLKVSWMDPHPNAAGDALLAQALYDGVTGLPERCWQKHGGGLP